MTREFDELIRKGDAESIRDAYDLLHKYEVLGGIRPDGPDEQSPDLSLNIDWDRLERIALAPSPREWVLQKAKRTPPIVRGVAALLAMEIALLMLISCVSWAQTKWDAEPIPMMRGFALLCVAAVGSLSAVVFSSSLMHFTTIVGSIFKPRPRRNEISATRPAHIAPYRDVSSKGGFAAPFTAGLCATLVIFGVALRLPLDRRSAFRLSPETKSVDPLIAYIGDSNLLTTAEGKRVRARLLTQPQFREKFVSKIQETDPTALDELKSRVVEQYITPRAELYAAALSLPQDKGFQIRNAAGKPVARTDRNWPVLANQAEQNVVDVLLPVVETHAGAADSPHQFANWVIETLDRDSDVRVDPVTATLHCTLKLNKDIFVGDVPLDQMYTNLAVFDGLDSYAKRSIESPRFEAALFKGH
jgi:hypothetical protein